MEKAIVRFSYPAEYEDELTLLEGETINIVDKCLDNGWWKGELNGRTGVFPNNFVEIIKEEADMDYHQEDHLDQLARMEFGTKKKHFERIFRTKQPLPTQPMTTKCEQTNSDESVSKAYDSKNQTAETIRPLKPPKAPKPPIPPKPLTRNHTLRTSRCYSSLKSPKKPEKGTTTTNESRFHVLENNFERELCEQVTEISSRKGRKWSPDNLEVFKHPLPLISTESVQSEDGKEEKIILKSENEVFEQIKQIDLPLVVVAVVGLYRSGKSYLMNRLAKSTKGGFELGNTIQSKTKGIWVWCKMHPTQKNTVLVLLDTEGLGDVDKDDQNHDNTIFTLATLLCNCLVYNIQTAFNGDALSKLTFVTEMASYIRYRGISSEDNEMLNLILPIFVLRIRDCSLELVKDGKPMSTNEYLEDCLADKKKRAAKFNKQRKCIRKYFPTRACFAFPPPGDDSAIRNLQHLSFDALCDKFKKATEIFVSYIYTIPPKDMSGSTPINGEMFVTLADRYVNAFKQGIAADVDGAFTAAAKIKNTRIKEEALKIFSSQMLKVVLPVSGNVFRRLYTKAQQAALEYLRQNTVTVPDLQADCEYQTQREMDELWNTMKEENDILVQQKCENTLQDDPVKRSIDKKLRNKDYETAGGYRKFQRDVELLKEGYFSNLRDFEEKEILWTWYGFIKCSKESEVRIVEADENLAKREKEEEQRRNQENIDKLMKEQQKAQKEALAKQKKDLDDHYKKLAEDRGKQIKVDQAKYEAFLIERFEKEAAQKELERFKEAEKKRKEKWFGARMWNALWNDELML
ncbi:guanylate-binding protein 1-like [Ruditapes philippinarum]|uniref:guanylate-binding protein 1-like n=1 Tax=Ruditapes philippinarum TaxID=129788 RepID=UPI00295B13B0|nr:guanylate-binding protein 1-like [Ruditapes philippinarum]